MLPKVLVVSGPGARSHDLSTLLAAYRLSFKLESVVGGAQAQERLSQRDLAAVVTEADLGPFDVCALLERLNHEQPRLPVLVVTDRFASADDQLVGNGPLWCVSRSRLTEVLPNTLLPRLDGLIEPARVQQDSVLKAMVALLGSEQRSCTLRVFGDRQFGSLHFLRGEVVSVECGVLRGAEALKRLYGLVTPTIECAHLPRHDPRFATDAQGQVSFRAPSGEDPSTYPPLGWRAALSVTAAQTPHRITPVNRVTAERPAQTRSPSGAGVPRGPSSTSLARRSSSPPKPRKTRAFAAELEPSASLSVAVSGPPSTMPAPPLTASAMSSPPAHDSAPEIEATQWPEGTTPDTLRPESWDAADVATAVDAAVERLSREPNEIAGLVPFDAVLRSLEKLLAHRGCVGVALLDLNAGLPLASVADAGFPIEQTGLLFVEVARAQAAAVRSIGGGPSLEDTLVAQVERYHLLRPLKSHHHLVLYTVLDRRRANLDLTRLSLAETERALRV